MRLVAIAAAVSLAACASVPNLDDVIDGPGDGSRPTVVGAHGPLSAEQSKAVLEKLRRDTGGGDVLQRHLALEQALTDSPLVVGNKVELLRDGPETFAAMFRAIAGAKRYIELEYYTFEDVEFEHQHIVDLLVKKAASGVRIAILYDGVGSIDTPREVFDRLRAAGVVLLEFNPIDPLAARAGNYSLNHRDHRKILVADGTSGIVGGVNLSTVYASSRLGRSGHQDGIENEHWRDTDLAITGAAVAELQQLFEASWRKQSGPPLTMPAPSPAHAAANGEVVRVIGSTPDMPVPLYYTTLLSAIRNAEQRIWISAAYFVPTHQALEDLLAAARRGVDVRLLLPSRSDSPSALAVGHSHYSDLLDAGVKIFEARGAILHAKTAVIDGVWSAVGSSNFDRRSVLFNDEVDIVVLGRATGARMEEMFERDFSDADAIDLAAWQERPIGERLHEFFSLLWSYWL